MNEWVNLITIGSASIGRWAGPGSDGQSPLAGQPSSLSRSLLRALLTFVCCKFNVHSDAYIKINH